ncbi:DNA-directed RNA polymerase subunit beta' [Candidatus Uhrbacteria bacterium RIFCSPHIGHO2_12_FULL_54_23]|uniref:DNA-directed RNA polymerase subunit beta' n=3 Tax=Candidatus Uhriibacteriota TaxID=1752732 RepID=A0A1F7UJJ5_9BACT|nr:MAG: DNA-directed RNA polymerase subunit beta' [Candidatus Uhrbacteria bacterium RIFCSPHIGHO2_12_FULL_54_23]OGL85552.1 MAG: DNA-directed RNA polymerase subunit beta' [Candidatus Uhrbacteria bacterium RIFCSPLOWO2_01_FULL_55_36]OGL90975.1 MAG: DNA-directed RNA polymerase subunit beta' [Candidatus Uhrbacteria bacterium RIFCSPLOWO2_02_FULL_54_37]
MYEDHQPVIDFDAIRLRLASPEAIRRWSFGEVTKPETINYRTQKPEKDGLFDERIFGPTKDWECYCGKYKRIRYKGIVCDKCGVEVTRAVVRRERMGHINLAAPVSHIWFLRGVPSNIGLMLDLSVQDLEKVVYFASFIVLKVHEDLREEMLAQAQEEYKTRKKEIEREWETARQQAGHAEKEGGEKGEGRAVLLRQKDERVRELDQALHIAKKELVELTPLMVISESHYQDLALKYGHVFEAGIGAEAIYELLRGIELPLLVKDLERQALDAPASKQKRILKRLRLVKTFRANGLKPEWLILTTIPVIPPDLRPMVQLDGGRFAASDLNDLYRRVINRNNRLKRLIELNAPEVITRNEKRMLQEAVDALIDNSARHGKTVTASTGQKRMLKSLADILKGKQGRFRQNLLGKRVDYSGRSVIVVGPHLELHQCGLPKRMALELFKPFVIAKLIAGEYVHNVRSANRFIESGRSEVWDILEEVTRNSHVLLNRAPTLHRLGIQAFEPKLIEGKAIQLHPLVCAAFNADFDGDQMAVHVPLTEEAKREAESLMLSSRNILKPATGEPVMAPQQDLVLGCFYLSTFDAATRELPASALKRCASFDEALTAYEVGLIGLRQRILVREKGADIETSAGRIIFNQVLPEDIRFVNDVLDKGRLRNVIARNLELFGIEATAHLLDAVKRVSLQYLTLSGISWGMDDLPPLPDKRAIIEAAEQEVADVEGMFAQGLLTDDERHVKVIELWARVKDEITKLSKKSLDRNGSVYAMIESGARGSWAQITQMMGMKGNVASPSGELIELPVKASFKEGLEVLEYFISTHGARKGLSDTALRTANAGYLTRRLIDVSQDVVILEEDCGDTEGFLITKGESDDMGESTAVRVKGRVLASLVKDPVTKKHIAKKGDVVTEERARALEAAGVTEVRVRSILSCKNLRGACAMCYGWDLGYNRLVSVGTAVGIIAAESIGEPGTQLTMRTFHTGGVAGADITQGLPRVEELFETRPVKRPALMAPFAGTVSLHETEPAPGGSLKQRVIVVTGKEMHEERFEIGPIDLDRLSVKDGDKVKKGAVLLETPQKKIIAPQAGTVEIREEEAGRLWVVVLSEREATKELPVIAGTGLWVRDGDKVERGDQLTEGSLDLHELFALKGKAAVQKYIMKEIQYIYSSQGQKLNDKHIEVIVRQIFSRVHVLTGGDGEFLPGEVLEISEFEGKNRELAAAGKKPATAKQLLLGITKSSLSTSSFLSAASFQETARVLIDAAVSGKVDHLRGLKENVIIGRLIPAGTGFRKT